MAPVVGFALISPQNEVLLQLRDNKPNLPYPGYWVIPGGGIEENETPREAATREIREEHPELSPSPEELLTLCTYTRSSDQVTSYIFAYRLKRNLDLTSIEGQCIQFFPLERIDEIELGFEQHIYIVPHLKQFLAE